jgi:hypothetical protein
MAPPIRLTSSSLVMPYGARNAARGSGTGVGSRDRLPGREQ